MYDACKKSKELVLELRVFGCGDNSCHFVKPMGMATNGGCRCREKIEAALEEAYTAGVDNSMDSKYVPK